MVSRLIATLRTNPQWRAIVLMLISTAGFSAMNVGVQLAAKELSAPLMVTLRNALTVTLLLPFVLQNRGALLRTNRLSNHAWRGVVGSLGMLTWTYCLTIMPLAHATALSFTAPLFSTVFAMVLFKEKADWVRWDCLIAGFGGTLVILNPQASDASYGDMLVIFSAALWAVTGMFVKSLSATEPPLRIVFYMNFFMLLVALPFGLMDWVMPSPYVWRVLLFIAVCSIVMHVSMARAYRLAPVSTLTPLDFTRLIYSSVLAYFIFGEVADMRVWAGGGIIIASAALMARRETRRA